MSKIITYYLSHLKLLRKLFIKLKLAVILAFFLIASTIAKAQITGCTGVLGKPLVTIDFGAGTTNVSADPAIMTTTYSPANWGTVVDGAYTISSNPVQNSGWHSGTDHTGNTNGRMLIVNADVAPGIFARISVGGLCPQTKFEFSAWISHLSMKSWCDGDSLPGGEGPFKPVNVKFIIEDKLGNVIKEGNTGDIKANRDNVLKWNQFALSFNTGANTDVVLKLQNNGKGGCGNDLAIDDISFAPCGPKLSYTPENACSDEAFEILVKGAKTQYNKPAYLWQKSTDNISWTDVGNPTYDSTLIQKILNTTNSKIKVYYRVYVAADTSSIRNAKCRVIGEPFSVDIFPSPAADFTFKVPYCINGAVSFIANVDPATIKSYSWTFKDGNPSTSNIKDPTVTWTKPGVYPVSLFVTDINGCTSGIKTKKDTIGINDKPKLNITSSNNFLFCIGKKVTLFATDGVKYTYIWYKDGVVIPGANTSTYEASANGTYKVLVTDSNKCFSDTAALVKSVDTIKASQSAINNVTCNGKNDGAAWVKILIKNASADTNNYTYKWSPQGGNFSKATNLPPNQYKVYVTDKKTGCMDTAAVTITEPETLSASEYTKDLDCFGDSNGIAKVIPAGGTQPYKYAWESNPAHNSAELTNLKIGTYKVLITDANNCTLTKSLTLKQSPFPPDQDTISANYCDGDSSITLYAKKGHPPYQWYEDGVPVSGATADWFKAKNLNKKITVTWYKNGCMHRSSHQSIKLPTYVFSPDIGTNIFTPNGDGQTDYFYPFSSKFSADQIAYYAKEYSLRVFDRWGKEIFETTDYAKGWDGSYDGGQATAGVYYWMTTYVSRCGSGDKKNTGKGYVHLMR